ncbi:O-unit flippase-like protein [Pedobacter sp. AJM]|uniref:O-unit flippase-like protein n=1 Tax=Pedobacter sp. AJM TaxID=2003629 RepID=UPI000B4C04F2|nr:O-unit flippase-like protein [Pedobacter sp. AJM]OWK71255.1 polysaccharide biosynthesis protein [Pedobacter sp. AJM]
MSDIRLSKKDVIWGYFAQFFSIASGVLVLPLILHLLSPEEIGMNYLMLTVGSLVSLFDFGFGPQFGRNITYIFSGAQQLKKEGIHSSQEDIKQINYRLLATMIYTVRFVYRRLSLVVLVVMLSFGTFYIYKVTNGFTNVHQSLFIWIVYSISTFFNMYYTYYASLLIGKGMIMESKKAMVYSRIVYIIINVSLLLLGVGLLSIAIANLLAPFVERFISHYYFFTKEFKSKIDQFVITRKEKLDLFNIVWHNARKLGLVFIGSYAITRFAMFLGGLYLSLSDIASYGLMVQLVGIISGISSTLFMINNPRFAELNITGNMNDLKKEFAFAMGIFYLLFLIGGVFLVLAVPELLVLIKAKAVLPVSSILILYLIVMLLETNHSFFATMIVIGNSVPFMWVSLITGGFIALGSYLSLSFTNYGLLGLVLVQGTVQLAYNNWKWPFVILNKYNISLFDFLGLIISEVFYRLKAYTNAR